ncbi:hypothetical protein [Halobacillus litoralis]|uniref:hypothetical protein n=1 Tax=Halobacillus litoralis TaxID=45668 RepID=UPI001CD6B58C|nr:hypothetical protein [Halobacillus litoralis]MCA1021648.1 hypothetical protein [Halobacillus litoralis]
MSFLNRDKDQAGKDIHTSARNDGNGNPITDVFDKEAHVKLDALAAQMQATNDRLNQTLDTQLTGSSMEQFGADISERPDASTVPVGYIFILVDTDEMWMSNGSTWVVKE